MRLFILLKLVGVLTAVPCDLQENFNTVCGHMCKARYSIGARHDAESCKNECYNRPTCQHWVWHKPHTKWSRKCLLVNIGTVGAYRNADKNTVTGTCQPRVIWMLSKQGQGDCHAVCKSHPRWVLQCNEKVGNLTTNLKQIDKVDKASYFKGIECKGWNKYDFGQGLSQCSSQCCNDGIYHCSVTTKWPGCKIPDKFAWGSHKRICPCSFFL